MSENKHAAYDLKQMQALPLSSKIRMTQMRIKEWYNYWDGQVYVSFSGGKDSTVLKHIIDNMGLDVPSVFVNTGLEYPEIQQFVKDVKSGKYDCFNSDVEIIRPEMRFDEVIKTYGYPVASKEVAGYVREAKTSKSEKLRNMRIAKLRGTYLRPDGKLSEYNCPKWGFLLDAPFAVSDKCCDVMKKKPINKYAKETGRKGIIGTMASESRFRRQSWIKFGCNMFNSPTKKLSRPLSFWTDQDVLEYIVKYDVPYASVYGEIVEDNQLEGQMYLDGCHGKLRTTGAERTGCMFCMFGCHLDKLGSNKDKNRFQLMKETHPKQYAYCMKSVEEGGLGIKEVLEYINVPWE